MRFYSTRQASESSKTLYSLREVCLLGLAPDGGLFLPCEIPKLPTALTEHPDNYALQDLARAIITPFFTPDLSEDEIIQIIAEVLSFPIPLVHIERQIFSLELYHGPTMAFKDFGALFLARVLSRLRKRESQELTVLVATSGDTGGAVANGFSGVPGVRVVVLYPQGRVSDFQEKQMTTLGGNITAIEVLGTFDDCQRLVKEAFQDEALRKTLDLSSANSINFARLLPQTFYYIEAIRELNRLSAGGTRAPIVVSVPSGNLGNLCAGVLAKRMGFPIDHFLLATNRNRVAVDYLEQQTFSPRHSERTLSNAMDVGNPSNLERLITLYEDHGRLREEITGSSWSEEDTREAVARVYQETSYILDPHGAVGYLALEDYLEANPEYLGVILETAHPAKFHEGVEEAIGKALTMPAQVTALAQKKKRSHILPADYGAIREFLVSL